MEDEHHVQYRYSVGEVVEFENKARRGPYYYCKCMAIYPSSSRIDIPKDHFIHEEAGVKYLFHQPSHDDKISVRGSYSKEFFHKYLRSESMFWFWHS